MRIVILGRGWLGQRFTRYFENRAIIYNFGRGDCDITMLSQVGLLLDECKPTVVINCAGKTHSATIPNIDGCIESLAARNETMLVNAVGAGNVAQACAERGIRLIHIGSGCIFNGYDEIFTETSTPNPPSYYAETKLLGDRMVLDRHPESLVLRIRMPLSAVAHPRNLITKLAHAERVVDVTNTVTVIENFMRFTFGCIRMHTKGIIHAVHREPLAFRELMQWYRERVDPNWNGTFVPPENYHTADGRSNAVVISTRTDIPQLQSTELAVKYALNRYGRNSQ